MWWMWFQFVPMVPSLLLCVDLQLVLKLCRLDRTVLRLPDEFRVDSRNGLCAELRVLLGPNGLVT